MKNPAQFGTLSAPQYPLIEGSFVVPETFLVILDMDEGTLSFASKDKYLGVAFRNLKGQKLYPIVSVVWGHCEVALKYLGGLDRELYFFYS